MLLGILLDTIEVIRVTIGNPIRKQTGSLWN